MIRGAIFHATRPAKLALLKAWGKAVAARYDTRETVCIFSSGRGGSTWVAEVLCAPPGTILQYEPFHPAANRSAARFGFSRARPWFTAARPPTPLQARFLRGILDGSFVNFETTANLQEPPPALGDFLRFRRFVVKFIHGNLALDWITRTYGTKALLLLRHPCAVVASQLRFAGEWLDMTRERLPLPPGLLDDFPRFLRVYETIASAEEALAFMWAVDALVPLSVPAGERGWTTVFYEDLVRDPVGGFAAVFSALGLEPPQNLAAIVTRPSRTVRGTMHLNEGWTAQLSPDQVQRILRVTTAMGADFYGAGTEPLAGSPLLE